MTAMMDLILKGNEAIDDTNKIRLILIDFIAVLYACICTSKSKN